MWPGFRLLYLSNCVWLLHVVFESPMKAWYAGYDDILRMICARSKITSSSVQLDIIRVSPAKECDIELNTRREIPYLQATMYYFVYYIKTLITRIRLSWRVAIHPVTCQQLIGDLKHTRKIILILHVWFFSVMEIPTKHSSLHNKIH